MTKEQAEIIFNNLKYFINHEISCIYWQLGERQGYKGILTEVVPFSHITIGTEIIDFVGNYKAIEGIYSENKPIYTNPNAQGYKGFIGLDIVMLLINEQKRQLGYSYEEKCLYSGHKYHTENNIDSEEEPKR